jgi:hypothetical protein
MLLKFSLLHPSEFDFPFCIQRLYAKQSDERAATFEKAVKMGDAFQNDTKSILLRINLIRNDFIVKPPSRGNEKGERRNK